VRGKQIYSLNYNKNEWPNSTILAYLMVYPFCYTGSMHFDWVYLIFYLEILLFVGGLAIALQRQHKVKSPPIKFVIGLCWFTVVLSTIILIPMFINTDYWDKTLPENGLLGITFLIILYVSFLAGALGFVFFGLVISGKMPTFAAHIKSPSKLQQKLTLKESMLNSFVGWISNTILYASLLFLVFVLFVPIVGICGSLETGACGYLNREFDKIVSFLGGALEFTPVVVGIIVISGVMSFITQFLRRD
jgi:hypothetical protein